MVITSVRSITFPTSRGFGAALSVVADLKHFGKVKVRLEMVAARWILSQLFPEGFDVRERRNLSFLRAHANLFVRALWLGWLILSATSTPSSKTIGFFE
jgi:hypothetical protein